MSLAEEIREYALDIGFDRVGFASAEPFPQLAAALEERAEDYAWISRGLLQLNKAVDPRSILPSARSLIVLIWDYHKQSFPQELTGKIGRAYLARLFLPKDRIFGARLKLFRDFLKQRGIALGTRPALPDRQAAARAGLGTFGRNTFIYVPGMGSFAAIVTMAVDVDLGGESREAISRCPDDCGACIRACPTGALYEPFRMNPRRCIAFNTYAPGNWPLVPEDIPREIREKMGSWIYGCDLCQEACPRNRKKLQEKLPPDAYLLEKAKTITLTNLLNMDEQFYLTQVQPFLYGYIWHKKFLQRNAAIALGNSGDDAAVPHLVRALEDPEEMVRAYAAWALGRIGGAAARAALESRRGREDSAKVLEEIEIALT